MKLLCALLLIASAQVSLLQNIFPHKKILKLSTGSGLVQSEASASAISTLRK